MTSQQPTPEAVEAVAGAIRSVAYGSRTTIEAARASLAFIRDAINRDSDDADAIRQALGLEWEVEFSSLGTNERVVGEWRYRS